MIEILNLRTHQCIHKYAYHVKIDRSNPLGNPFYMANESQRDKVCNQYQEWFNNTVLISKQVSSYTELLRLLDLYKKHGKLKLFCWCAPKRCHGETIKQWLESQLS